MGIFRQFMLFCAIWCFLDTVYSFPSHTNKDDLLLSTPTRSRTHRLLEPTPTLTNFNECGKSRKTNRDKPSIIGGKRAELGDWPWMVALLPGSPSAPILECLCGGSLISTQWVVTAAHCFLGQCAPISFARLGDLDLDDQVPDGASYVDIMINKSVMYPQFMEHPKTNDIALVRLKKPVPFTEFIHPICLFKGEKYNSSDYYAGKEAFIAGWGNTKWPEGSISTALLETSVDTVEPEKCAQQYSNMTNDIVIDEKVICAARPGKDACTGDSGGPLMLLNEDDGRFYLGGIISGGEGCADSKYSGVYTKVTHYAYWISKTTGRDL